MHEPPTTRPCEHVLELLDRKLIEVDAQVRAPRDFRQELGAMREEAAHTAAADACVCGIIEHHVTLIRPEHGGVAAGLVNRGPNRRR